MRCLPVLCLILAAHPAGAQGTPALEAGLARAEPCAGLERTNRLDRLRIDDLTVTTAADTLTATLTGHIACRSTGAPVLQARAFTGFEAEAQLSLSTCRPIASQVTLLDPAAATILFEPFRDHIAAVLSDHVSGLAAQACRAIR
ncbi:hypothetical protein HKCCE3408_12435 [Rhodobacterales bacterium HKCCE3408]|nr:hypothetical protein [Rhodobacterales bacterium HKCCE3408]